MAGVFMNINGAIVADTVYSNNTLCARDVAVTLPEVTPVMSDVEAMGTMSLPVWARLDNMELAITKIGMDLGLRNLLTPGSRQLELRFPQETLDQNGNQKTVSCKAFLNVINAKIPGIGVTPGEASSNELTMTVTRYQLYVDGKEYYLIDRLAGVVKINGTDYASGVKSML